MTRRLFAIGDKHTTLVNVDGVSQSNGWLQLLHDLFALEAKERRAFHARMLRPKMPKVCA